MENGRKVHVPQPRTIEFICFPAPGHMASEVQPTPYGPSLRNLTRRCRLVIQNGVSVENRRAACFHDLTCESLIFHHLHVIWP